MPKPHSPDEPSQLNKFRELKAEEGPAHFGETVRKIAPKAPSPTDAEGE